MSVVCNFFHIRVQDCTYEVVFIMSTLFGRYYLNKYKHIGKKNSVLNNNDLSRHDVCVYYPCNNNILHV